MPIRLASTIALLAALVTACGSGGGAAGSGGLGKGLPGSSAVGTGNTAGRLAVVAGENVWGNVVAQIGGDLVSVTSIITNPDQDPHAYESTLDDAAAIAHARLVVGNGAGYDNFVGKLLSAASGSRAVITVADVVGVNGSNANPHFWYRPSYVVAAARAIEAELARQLPARANVLAANLARFLAGEQRVSDVIAAIRAKYAGAKVAYTEPVAGYLVDDAGLKLGTPLSFSRAIEDGTDPSPVDDALFKAALAQHTVAVLIYNAQVVDKTTTQLKQLAAGSQVPIVGVTETLPPAQPTLQSWQAAQASALRAALGG